MKKRYHNDMSGKVKIRARGRAVAWLVALAGVFCDARTVFATQAHVAPEGLYAHQFAHIFFIVSMGILIYWLRSRRLVKDSGWRFIQYSALFFILWSIDTFLVHLLDEQFDLIRVTRIGNWQLEIVDPFGGNALGVFYYFAKLDHLLCVPALLFLYAGLRRLLQGDGLSGVKDGSA